MQKVVKRIFVLGIMLGQLFGINSVAMAKGELTVGTEVLYLKYEEPDVMEITGPMYGAYAQYVLRGLDRETINSFNEVFENYQSNYMFRLDGRLVFGSVDYDSQETGSSNNASDYALEIRGVAGYDFPVMKDSVFTPYIGLGYRYFDDNFGGKISTTGAYGYDRESHYFYLPIGMTLALPISDQWHWGIGLEYDFFIHGKQKSHLEDVDVAYNTLENDQEEGFGVRGSVQIGRRTKSIDFLVEPFVRYWDIDESNSDIVTCGGTPCAAGYEPKNETMEYGIKLGAEF